MMLPAPVCCSPHGGAVVYAAGDSGEGQEDRSVLLATGDGYQVWASFHALDV